MAAEMSEKDSRVAAPGVVTSDNQVSEKGALPEPEPKKSSPFIFVRLLFYGATWIDVALLIVGTISAIGAGIPFPLMAILFGQLVNDLNSATCEASTVGRSSEYAAGINEKVLLLVYISIGAFGLTFLYIVSWNIRSQRLAQRLRENYFQSLLRLEQSFFDKRHAGEVSSRLNADIQAVQSGTCEKVGIFIASISFFATAYVVAFIKQSTLAGILISLVPAFLLVSYFGGKLFQRFSARMSDAMAAASSIASEALSHIAVVEAFGAGPRLEKKFASDMTIAREQGIKRGVVAASQAGMLYFIAYSANALAFWQGSTMIAKLVSGGEGGETVGSIYTVVFILVDACVVLGAIAPLLPLFGGAASAFQKLRKDMDHISLIDGTSYAGISLGPDSPGTIEFRNVTFAYPSRPGEPVLKNLNLSIPAGKHTAIVGQSGSGKSTIAGLMARLHDPTEGTVTFDNQDLRDLKVRDLRGFMSLVSQEPSLLDRSILENIALGLVNSPMPSHQHLKDVLLGAKISEVASSITEITINQKEHQFGQQVTDILELVRNAADLADAATFINKLERGYGTMVGTGGKMVSGGQRQRIALARALVRDPKILILDEATASLDSSSEQRIQKAIDQVAQNRTVVSIAHRLSTIKHADNIVVFKAGEIVEQGTYSELMALEGLFAGMVALQSISSSEQGAVISASSTIKGSLDMPIEKRKIVDEKPLPLGSSSSIEATKEKIESTEPEDSGLDGEQSTSVVLKGMVWLIRPTLPFLVLAMFAAVIVGCTYTASGLIFGNTLGALSTCDNTADQIRSNGRYFGGLFFMLACVEFLANLISWSSFGLVAEKLLYRVRVLSFRSLFEQSVEWHQSSDRSPSMLLSVITKDTAALGGFTGSVAGTIFAVFVNFLVAIITSHIIAWKIAIVCLTMVPFLLGAGIMQLRTLSRYEERNAASYAKSIGISVEAINSIKTIATLSIEDEVMGTYTRVLKSSRDEMVAASVYTNIWFAISTSTGYFVYAFAYWWGSQLIMRGEYTQEQFFIVLVSMLVSAQLWGQMFSLAPEVSRSRSSASRILSLIKAGSSDQNSSAPLEVESSSKNATDSDIEATAEAIPHPISGNNRGVSVSFNNVSFSYPNRPGIQVLQDINFTIQPGQFIGLVGPSGAGKSTMIGLVQRMYTPTQGSVTIDGVNVLTKSFRDDIAVVPQDNALFNASIKFNVGLGARPGTEATDAEIEEACKLANIHDTIMSLPKGYETECGPNGSQLSGGQRQRLTIARALVRKPRLLLLDESTSALDAESETALQEGLERAVKEMGVTVIAITHRLHTVLKADVIFVVEGGQVVDKGRHQELLGRSESYRDNAMSQMLG
ncbi:hypothetical protein HYALB_00008188 [Hymenoscyphus albidus]|uniref:Uncharacterized protein n=1 Tax=Hymenoscyphus albidus TaxID=595503 RepID=A0A9N9LTM5_9HELO|nr:hypothetical protein HYALB_00008188 [Hymenoscyphus albidus]